MAEIIPWSEFEEEYSSQLSDKMGAPGKPFRMALASLIIKEKLGISDRETDKLGKIPIYNTLSDYQTIVMKTHLIHH